MRAPQPLSRSFGYQSVDERERELRIRRAFEAVARLLRPDEFRHPPLVEARVRGHGCAALLFAGALLGRIAG